MGYVSTAEEGWEDPRWCKGLARPRTGGEPRSLEGLVGRQRGGASRMGHGRGILLEYTESRVIARIGFGITLLKAGPDYVYFTLPDREL